MRFAKPLLAAFALVSTVTLSARAELDIGSLKQSIESIFESEYPKLDAVYKDIHSHPELAFQEDADRGPTGRRDARDRLRGHRKGRQDRGGCALQKRRRPDRDGAHRARCAADGGKDRPPVCQPRQGDLARARDLRGSQLRSRRSHGELGRHGPTLVDERPVARHADVRGPAGRGTACRGAKAMLADGLFTRFPKPDFAFALHTLADRLRHPRLTTSGSADLELRRPGDHVQGPRRPRLRAAARRSIPIDGRALHRRRADRHQPRERPHRVRRRQRRRNPRRHRGNIIPDEVVLRGTIRTFKAEVRAREYRAASSGRQRLSPPCRMRRSTRSRSPKEPRP